MVLARRNPCGFPVPAENVIAMWEALLEYGRY